MYPDDVCNRQLLKGRGETEAETLIINGILGGPFSLPNVVAKRMI